MALRVKGASGLPLFFALFGGLLIIAYFIHPAELRRGPIMEIQRFFLVIPTYEVHYTDCRAMGSPEDSSERKGILGVTRDYGGKRFPARSDEDAIEFVTNARPNCRVQLLYRLKRVRRGGRMRWDKTRVFLES